jgi:hypothetical protein
MYYFNTNLVQQYRGTAYSSCSTVVRRTAATKFSMSANRTQALVLYIAVLKLLVLYKYSSSNTAVSAGGTLPAIRYLRTNYISKFHTCKKQFCV